MRKTKFRGQRYMDKSWIYGFLIAEDIIVEEGAVCVDDDYISFSDEWCSVLPESVGQFTGEHAPNGELYEGDIFEGGEGKVRSLVFWDESNNCWAVKNLVRNEIHPLDRHFRRFIGNVVGNIHDNPELLNASARG